MIDLAAVREATRYRVSARWAVPLDRVLGDTEDEMETAARTALTKHRAAVAARQARR